MLDFASPYQAERLA